MSLDGPRDLHDATRIDAKGRGTFEAIRLLREHDGVPFGAIAVIGEAHRNRAGDLFDTFRELGIWSYDVHPNFGMGSHATSRPLSPRDYADFMIELFDAWLSAGDPSDCSVDGVGCHSQGSSLLFGIGFHRDAEWNPPRRLWGLGGRSLPGPKLYPLALPARGSAALPSNKYLILLA